MGARGDRFGRHEHFMRVIQAQYRHIVLRMRNTTLLATLLKSLVSFAIYAASALPTIAPSARRTASRSFACRLALGRLLRHILHQLLHPAVEVGAEPAQVLGAGVVAPLIDHLGERHAVDAGGLGHLADGDAAILGKFFLGN